MKHESLGSCLLTLCGRHLLLDDLSELLLSHLLHMVIIYRVTSMDSSVGYDHPIYNTYLVYLETCG